MLRNLWKHLAGAGRSLGKRRSIYYRPRRLAVEPLEDRRLLTAIIRGPYLQEPGFYPDPPGDPVANSMVMMWQTDEASDSKVDYRVGEGEWQGRKGVRNRFGRQMHACLGQRAFCDDRECVTRLQIGS